MLSKMPKRVIGKDHWIEEKPSDFRLFSYGVECLFRFYTYGLEEHLRPEIFEDFQRETLRDYEAGKSMMIRKKKNLIGDTLF